MRVAVTWPGDPVVHVVEAPDEAGERAAWVREKIGGELDYTTLSYWTNRNVIIQMVSDDWFLAKELPANEAATRLYGTGHQICGPAVIESADREGAEIPLPDKVVDRWILAGLRVDGT